MCQEIKRNRTSVHPIKIINKSLKSSRGKHNNMITTILVHVYRLSIDLHDYEEYNNAF